MKQLKSILRIVRDYRSRQGQYIVFNALASIFSLFSIAALIPFLEVVFNQDTSQVLEVKAFSWKPEMLLEYLDYRLRSFIVERGSLTSLYYFSGAIIVLFLLKNVFNYLSFYTIAFTRSGVVRDLRKRVYHKLVDLPVSFYSEERKGDIISRLTNDVKEVEWGVVGAIEMLFKHPFYILFYIISLVLISWKLTVFSVLILPISGYLISRIAKRLKSTAQKGQKKLGEVINVIEETLGGLKVIKGFNAEGQIKNFFDRKNGEHFKLMLKLHRKELAASPVSEFLGSVVISAILMFGGAMVLNQTHAIDGKYFIAYIAIFAQLITPAKSLTESYFRVQKASASFERLSSILETENTIVDPKEPKRIEQLTSAIRYEDVSFSYGDKEVISNMSFEIRKGQTVALVGASGGGKSTLADLLPRFYDVKSGAIHIDQYNIKDLSIEDLRSKMGIVTQEPILFNDSVLENIRLGNQQASREDAEKAARIANAHDFISTLENGYDTHIGDRGSKLSGGQRQRVAIARAVLKNPEILILDEATSALDTESEKLVQEAIENLMKGRTSLVIAHRLSTIKHADNILVIDRGRVVEQGTHSELIDKDGHYKKLVDLQGFS
ncbi:MAG: ABC transporter ATP-binding protein [Bacteroidia bacterium]|nr:ABC transporter ATP-binding protein [Bacteroidia bacterium]